MFLLSFSFIIRLFKTSRKAGVYVFDKTSVFTIVRNEYCYVHFLHKMTYLWFVRSRGGGELSLSVCPGAGNRPPSKKKIANPWGCARAGHGNT